MEGVSTSTVLVHPRSRVGLRVDLVDPAPFVRFGTVGFVFADYLTSSFLTTGFDPEQVGSGVGFEGAHSDGRAGYEFGGYGGGP